MTIAPRYVHCNSHGAPHPLEQDGSCWCTCVGSLTQLESGSTVLAAQSLTEAFEECKTRNLWLYDPRKYQ